MSHDWKRFGKEPLTGIYWVAGERPEYDVDVDDYGQQVAWHSGESNAFLALVEIDFDPQPGGVFEVLPVNEYATGKWEDDYAIHPLPRIHETSRTHA